MNEGTSGGQVMAAGDLQQSSLYIVQFVANTGFEAQGRVLGALSLADINGLVEALAGKADATTLNQLVRVVQTGAAGRPGDAPEAWSGQVAGLPEAMVPVANPDVRLTADGRVLRLTGEQLVAPRWWLRLDPTRKYQVRWIYTRPADVVDPAGASVRAQMAWLDGAGSSVQGSTTINTRTPSASAGRQVVTAVMAAAAAADVTVVWPAGAAYARPWLQTYQAGSVTDLEAIEIADLTDLGGFSPDLTALQASVAALAPIPARVTALETLATGSRIARFATRAEAAAAQIAANVDFVEVQSHSLTTPRVPALYERTGASAIGGFQSANGAFWKPAWRVTQLEMLGAFGDGSANDQAAWAIARTLGREVYLSGTYLVTDPSNTAGVRLYGPGRLIMAVTGGHVQRNSRFDLGPVMFRSHLFAVKNKLLFRTAIRLILLGDSTVADSQIDLAAQVRAELETLGVAVAEVTNAAIAGHAWGTRNLATVLDGFAAQKDIVFLKFGINDAGGSDVPGPSDIPAKAASMNTAMRQRLSEIRSSPYGALANLSIVLVLPTAMGNSADNAANDRNNLWIESIREIYLEAARDYTCAIYAPYIEARNAEGGGGRWLDDMLVHPKPNLNLDVWPRMVRDLLTPGGDIPVNRLVQRRADQGTAPLTSDGLTGILMGVSVMRTPAGDGWPIAGTVLTVRHPDNTAIQTGYDFQYGAPRIRTRSWLTASGVWSNWDNTTQALILGSGLGQTGGVAPPSMTRTAEGDVRLAGSATASADIAVNAIIAYLPAGYRPALDAIRFVHTYGNTVVRLRIKTNGQILTETPITTGTIITFGGIVFSAAGQQVAFSPVNWFTAGRQGLYLEA